MLQQNPEPGSFHLRWAGDTFTATLKLDAPRPGRAVFRTEIGGAAVARRETVEQNDLGATPVQAFLRVTLPLSLPGVISGITLVFLPAVSSFFIPKLLGGGQYVLVGNIIETQFLTTGDWNFGSAISLIMAVIIMISMWLTRKADIQVASQGKE